MSQYKYQRGFAHHLLLIAVVVVVGIVSLGSYTAVSSYADTASAARKHKKVKVHAARTNVLYYNYSHKDQYHRVLVTYRPGQTNAPWVMVIHGGTWVRGDDTSMRGVAATFAKHGYTVFNVDYPLLNPHNEYPGQPGATFQTQRASLYDALRWIRTNHAAWGINMNRGAVFGFSAGGHLALDLGLTGSGAPGINVVITASGVVSPERVVRAQEGQLAGELGPNPNDNEILNILQGMVVQCPYAKWATDAACAARWRDFNPKYRASPGDPPVYMFSGTADPLIPHYSAGEVAAYLKAHGVYAEAHYVDGMQHTPDTALGTKNLNFTLGKLHYYTR